MASCLPGCPLGIDIPGFIRLLREDDVAGALSHIQRENPFPSICGRICPAPCEHACIFQHEGAPIEIRLLERYAADFAKSRPQKERKALPPGKDKKVAIVGSGPTGMSAAFFLAQAGYGVTIFEAMGEAGGLLRYGVPEFRLPQKILDEQIAELRHMGVQFVFNAAVGSSLTGIDIFAQGYSALLMGVGASLPVFTQMPGHHWGGVYYAPEFFLRSQLFSKLPGPETVSALFLGERTAVVGGDYPALDAARLALRLGQEVDLFFEGLEEEMDVHGEDLKAAVEEGVRVHASVKVLSIEADPQGFARGMTCRFDAERFVEAQSVVLSLGLRPNGAIRHHLPQLRFNPDETIWTDQATAATSIDKIFAAGDVATGAGTVVDAIASGKAAAKKIKEFLER